MPNKKKNYKRGTDYNILYRRQDSDYYMSSSEKKALEKKEQYFLNEEGAKHEFLKLNIYMKLLRPEMEAKEQKKSRTRALNSDAAKNSYFNKF